jgi:hypothetical protein
MAITPKEQYEKSIQSILQIVMDIPDLNDNVWKAIADETSVLWRLREQLTRIQTLRVEVRNNRYYRQYVSNPQRRERSAQSSAQDDEIIPCDICRRPIKNGWLDDHKNNTKVCIDIQQVRKLERDILKNPHRTEFCKNNMKIYILLNYFIAKHKTIHTPRGLWWVYNLDGVMFRAGFPHT